MQGVTFPTERRQMFTNVCCTGLVNICQKMNMYNSQCAVQRIFRDTNRSWWQGGTNDISLAVSCKGERCSQKDLLCKRRGCAKSVSEILVRSGTAPLADRVLVSFSFSLCGVENIPCLLCFSYVVCAVINGQMGYEGTHSGAWFFSLA